MPIFDLGLHPPLLYLIYACKHCWLHLRCAVSDSDPLKVHWEQLQAILNARITSVAHQNVLQDNLTLLEIKMESLMSRSAQ